MAAANKYGPGSGTIWLGGVKCEGTETSLKDCKHNVLGQTDCDHKRDVSVECVPEPTGIVLFMYRFSIQQWSSLMMGIRILRFCHFSGSTI